MLRPWRHCRGGWLLFVPFFFHLATCLSPWSHSVICSTHSWSGFPRTSLLAVAVVEGKGPTLSAPPFHSLLWIHLSNRRAFDDVVYPDPSPYSFCPTDNWTSCIEFPCFCSFYLVSFPWLSEEWCELYFSVTDVIFWIAGFNGYICFLYFLP